MDSVKELSRIISSRKEEMVSFFKKLVEIPTVNPPGENYEECVEFLKKKCESLGLATRIIRAKWKDKRYPRPNLVALWRTGSKKTLHYNGHYDVVPATSRWKTPPYKLVRKGDKLFGRGVADMKGSLASVIFAVEAMKKAGIRPGCNLELSFTCDEETGGEAGLGYLVKKRISESGLRP